MTRIMLGHRRCDRPKPTPVVLLRLRNEIGHEQDAAHGRDQGEQSEPDSRRGRAGAPVVAERADIEEGDQDGGEAEHDGSRGQVAQRLRAQCVVPGEVGGGGGRLTGPQNPAREQLGEHQSGNGGVREPSAHRAQR
jgi:hypothetical protein